MRKHLVPTAPVPSWTSAANKKPGSSTGRSFYPASSQLPPLDAGFLRGVYSALMKLGVALTFVAFALSQSIQITWSFAAGVFIAGSLLKAQEYFATRIFAARNHNMTQPNGLLARIAGRFPLWIVVALKYIGVIFAMWFLLRFANMSPVAFVLGFLVLKAVIVGSVIGRMYTARSIRDMYIRPHNCHLS